MDSTGRIYDLNIQSDRRKYSSIRSKIPMVIPPTPRQLANKRVGRNDPCPCGSGLKFKKCHYKVTIGESNDTEERKATG